MKSPPKRMCTGKNAKGEWVPHDSGELPGLARGNSTPDPKSESSKRIFGPLPNEVLPKGHVRITLLYSVTVKRIGYPKRYIPCLVRGDVPSSTPAKDVVAKTVESAKQVGLGTLLNKANCARFPILRTVPDLTPIGTHNTTFTEANNLLRVKVVFFIVEENKTVKRQLSMSFDVTSLSYTLLDVLQTTRAEIEKNLNVRAALLIANSRGPVIQEDKPLRNFLKYVDNHLVSRPGDDIPSVQSRIQWLARRISSVNVLINKTKNKGDWISQLENHDVTWRFEEKTRVKMHL